ncbi:hypothetical protein UF06_21635 [Vibrio sp. S234-5]|nr:hypothetical protein UF06_21635 [Vibrio sp. S234-5]
MIDEGTVAEGGRMTEVLTSDDSSPDGGLEITHIYGVALTVSAQDNPVDIALELIGSRRLVWFRLTGVAQMDSNLV